MNVSFLLLATFLFCSCTPVLGDEIADKENKAINFEPLEIKLSLNGPSKDESEWADGSRTPTPTYVGGPIRIHGELRIKGKKNSRNQVPLEGKKNSLKPNVGQIEIEFVASPFASINTTDFSKLVRKYDRLPWEFWGIEGVSAINKIPAEQTETTWTKEQVVELRKLFPKAMLSERAIAKNSLKTKETFTFEMPERDFSEEPILVPFEFEFRPSRDFLPDHLYQFKTVESKLVHSDLVGVFQTSVREEEIRRDAESIGRNFLKRFGIDLDAWLKPKAASNR